MNIRCAVCNKPVDRVETWHDHLNRCQWIAAHCHGTVDVMRFNETDLVMIRDLPKQLEHQEGVAFTTKELGHGEVKRLAEKPTHESLALLPGISFHELLRLPETNTKALAAGSGTWESQPLYQVHRGDAQDGGTTGETE
jgi:hypothetical protein